MRPSQFGFLDAQAGQYNLTATANNKQTVGRPAAGVTVTNANHIHFERNLFTQMAATGLDFISGTHDDMIHRQRLHRYRRQRHLDRQVHRRRNDRLSHPLQPPARNEICTNDTIKNNYIHDVTTEIQGACGIAAGYPRTSTSSTTR